MDIMIIPKGTTVKVAGMPFGLAQDTIVLGRRENVFIEGVRIIGEVPKEKIKKP